jgi:predicted DCC family thiol-disulfide oxidoreductase YuxK
MRCEAFTRVRQLRDEVVMTTATTGKISETREARGTILYDGTCGLCGRFFPRFASSFHKRGLRPIPLQSPEASEISGADRARLLTQMHVVTADRKLIGGLDAVLFIASAFWWLRPLVLLARIRWIHRAMDSMRGIGIGFSGRARSAPRDSVDRARQ